MFDLGLLQFQFRNGAINSQISFPEAEIFRISGNVRIFRFLTGARLPGDHLVDDHREDAPHFRIFKLDF